MTQQKQWFIQEEAAFQDSLQSHHGLGMSSIPLVWDISFSAWTQHPGLLNVSKGEVSDCLHFCVPGDGFFGVYEAFNRIFWWQMLNTLPNRTNCYDDADDDAALDCALTDPFGPLRAYSEALYGRWVDLSHARVLWPELMSKPDLDRLSRRFCLWLSHPNIPLLSDPNSRRFYMSSFPGSKGFTNASHGNLLQHGALWLHQPVKFRTPSVESHTWVEVTHCYYKHSASQPLWLFNAQGSGIWMHVGNSLVLSMRNSSAIANSLHRSAAVHEQAHVLHSALLTADRHAWMKALRLFIPPDAPLQPTELDSIQFVDWMYGPIFLTELVMLRWTEADWDLNVAATSTHAAMRPRGNTRIACGVYPELRPCTQNDHAVHVQRGCQQPMAGKSEVMRLLNNARKQKCSAALDDVPAVSL